MAFLLDGLCSLTPTSLERGITRSRGESGGDDLLLGIALQQKRWRFQLLLSLSLARKLDSVDAGKYFVVVRHWSFWPRGHIVICLQLYVPAFAGTKSRLKSFGRHNKLQSA